MRKLIFLVLTLTACGNEPRAVDQQEWYDLPALGNHLVKTMAERASAVDKTVLLNGTEEKRQLTSTDSLFWVTELASLIETDINAPKYAGVISKVSGLTDKKSNLKIDSYSITSEADLPLESCRLFYLDSTDELRKIELVHRAKNIIADSRRQTTIWLNRYAKYLLVDSIISSGTDKVLFQGSRAYQLKLQRIPTSGISVP